MSKVSLCEALLTLGLSQLHKAKTQDNEPVLLCLEDLRAPKHCSKKKCKLVEKLGRQLSVLLIFQINPVRTNPLNQNGRAVTCQRQG